jgi:hypothetical protein
VPVFETHCVLFVVGTEFLISWCCLDYLKASNGSYLVN